MPFSSIDLCARALIKVGAEPIASFDDGTVEARVAASLYPAVRDAVLSFHPWNFAIAQKRLAALVDEPVAGFQRAFSLPPDSLRVLSAGSAGEGRGVRYRIVGDRLLTDASEVILTYVGRADEALYPPYFALAIIARLAAEFCIPLTDSTTRWKALHDLAEAELRRARLCDAQEETPAALRSFPLIEERL